MQFENLLEMAYGTENFWFIYLFWREGRPMQTLQSPLHKLFSTNRVGHDFDFKIKVMILKLKSTWFS